SVTQVGFVAGMGRQPSRSPRIDALRTAPYRRDVNGSNPTQHGRHGRALAIALAAALLCAACGRDGDGDAAQADAEGHVASGSVAISGDDSEAGDLSWSRPRVELDAEAADEAQEQAGAALEEGRLYDDDESAIPLFLALLDRDADDAGAKAGLERARQRLLAMGDEALADAGEDFVALREARRVAAVARAVWPGDGEVEAYLQRVDLADQLWQLNRAAEDDIEAGNYGVSGGGALEKLRRALELSPGQPRAMQNMAAVESALIRRAEVAAE